jgi:hypothetical protein
MMMLVETVLEPGQWDTVLDYEPKTGRGSFLKFSRGITLTD